MWCDAEVGKTPQVDLRGQHPPTHLRWLLGLGCQAQKVSQHLGRRRWRASLLRCHQRARQDAWVGWSKRKGGC